MNLIAHANNIYMANKFKELVLYNNNIQGLSLNIIMTKDKKIIAYETAPDNQISISSIENHTLDEINQYKSQELDDILSYFQKLHYQKKMFFHLTPLTTGPLNEDTIVSIRNQNYTYVKTIADIAEKYPDLNLYFSSVDYNLIYFMKELMKKEKIGVTLSYSNMNYIDTDFYEFYPNMLDFMLIHQQINLGKDVVVLAHDDNDMSLLFQAFKNKDNTLSNELFSKIIFNTTYPEILYFTFQNKT